MTKIAVLDDWQSIARQSADWSQLESQAEIVFFSAPFGSEDEAAASLRDFDIILTMRERMAFPVTLVERLKNLKMLGMTGKYAPVIDREALMRRGVTVCYTPGGDSGANTAELALCLMLAAARKIVTGDKSVRSGTFQAPVPLGFQLAGKTLGLIGLGRIGTRMARYGRALDMEVIAWSPNLTEARAREAGAGFVPKDELLARSDVVSLHLVLSERTRGIIDAGAFGLLKPGAIFVNTSRAGLTDSAALLEVLRAGRIIAALDVFNREPLPQDDSLITLPNVVLTPHLGYATRETYQEFYRQSIENALAFLAGAPIRVMPPA